MVLLAGLVLGPSAGLLAGSEPEEFFETKIRPLFAAQCQSCHDAKQKLGGLDLTQREGLDREGSGGAGDRSRRCRGECVDSSGPL